MSKRKRTLLAIIVVQLFLAGIWYYLHTEMATSPSASPDSARVIGQSMGGLMGLLLGLTPLLYLMARRNDLNKDAQKGD